MKMFWAVLKFEIFFIIFLKVDFKIGTEKQL